MFHADYPDFHFLAIKHLHRYTCPKQQLQIIRIIFTPVVYASFNCVSTLHYSITKCIQPLITFYETIALASLFLLSVEYVAPDEHSRLAFFAAMINRKKRGTFGSSAGEELIPGGSQVWFERTWSAVSFYVIVNVVATIAEKASQATGDFCSTSWSPRFAHTWVVVLNSFFLGSAVMSIVRFYMRMKEIPEFACHKPGLKLISFKIIVALKLGKKSIFGEIKAPTSARLTGYDFRLGIPAVVVAGEQIFFAIFFHYSFASHEYRPSMKGDTMAPRMGIMRAAAHALDPMDLIVGLAKALRYIPSLIGRGSNLPQIKARPDNVHLEPLSNRLNEAWSLDYSAPIYKVTDDSPRNTGYSRHYIPAGSSDYAQNQAGYPNWSEESYIGAGYGGRKHEEEALNLPRIAM